MCNQSMKFYRVRLSGYEIGRFYLEKGGKGRMELDKYAVKLEIEEMNCVEFLEVWARAQVHSDDNRLNVAEREVLARSAQPHRYAAREGGDL